MHRSLVRLAEDIAALFIFLCGDTCVLVLDPFPDVAASLTFTSDLCSGRESRARPFHWLALNCKIYASRLIGNELISLVFYPFAQGSTWSFSSIHWTLHSCVRLRSSLSAMPLKNLGRLDVRLSLPLWTLMMLSDYASLTEQQYRIINIYIYPFAHWLAFFNSSVNPIIYGFFNENFRRGFQAVFKFSLCAADGQRRKTYTRRLQGNSVLPANNVQTSLEPISLNSLDKSTSRRLNHVTERDMVMEDLEKGSCSSGGVTAVSIWTQTQTLFKVMREGFKTHTRCAWTNWKAHLTKLYKGILV